VIARKGRFGPYAQWGKMVANLPRSAELTTFTLNEAVALLAEKGKELVPKGKKGSAKKATGRAAAKAKAPAPPTENTAKIKAKAKPKPKVKAKAKAKTKAKPKAKALVES
jgi:DNA topoisomerase-1